MELTASQLAELVKGTVEGDSNVIINNFAKIEEAKQGCLTFLANPKYTHFIYSTDASAVLVRNDFVPEQHINATLIRVADPYATLADLLNFVNSHMAKEKVGIEQPSFVSEGVSLPDDIYLGAFAYIGKGAYIGKHVKIYPQVYVGDGVTIGDNVILYTGVKIYHSCRIGNGCIIHAGAVIGADGFGFAPTAAGYEKIAQIGNVVIDDNVEIGANTTIDRATMGSTHVHQGVKLDNLIQVAHNVEIGEHTVIAAQTGIAGSTKLGSHNMIGGQVGFAGHISVGDNNKIGAQTGIPNNVDDNNILMGYPAVPARDFARQAVWVKKLGSLYADVAEIKKKLND